MVEIRRATPDDAAAIAAIHVRSSLAAYQGLLPDEHLRSFTIERRTDGWRASLVARDSQVWIAVDAGHPLGWICAGRSRDPDAGAGTAELWAMYVDPQHWRQGIGRALWACARDDLLAAGFSAVTLWLLRENTRARSFYDSIGFLLDPGHAKTRDRAGVAVVELRMRLELTSSRGDVAAP